MDTAQFAARYVPDMASIVHLRDVLVSIAIEGAREHNADARKNLFWMSLTGAATLMLVVMIFLVIRWRVVGPLFDATRVLVDIAHGNLNTEVPSSDRADEVGDMLSAVGALKANSIEKQLLEEERQRLIDELKQMSSTDFLTGLFNRRAFAGIAESQIASAKRHAWPLALILFDIDHFKSVNDRFGHDAGDAVLVELAAMTRRVFREGDFVARHGGEEFVALAPQCEFDAALALAERMRATIEAADITLSDGERLKVTASFGVVSLATPVDTLDTLTQRADRALYAAKAAGRNRVVGGDAPAAPA
jgi:diguanylate cyclase (GGDEF)-like protein